jgi:palmitoyltransferase
MDPVDLQRLAPPGVTALVAFLALTSQWLFYYIEPGPLKTNDALIFNILVGALLVCYWRTCLTDPGQIPKDWPDRVKQSWSRPEDLSAEKAALSNRWCRRCEILKPPRAHHCKTCKRYQHSNHDTCFKDASIETDRNILVAY